MTTLLNEHRETVFLDRYARRDSGNRLIERTPQEMWVRVANAIGDTPDEVQDFTRVLTGFKFVPGGRILAGAGKDTEQTYYNCYVIPVEPKESTRSARPDVGNDSREAIFDTIATMVDIMSRGGGVGINWSVLRPSGSHLARVSGTSSGPVGWMDVASKAVGEVEQGGSRRGAAMFMLDDWHPDILNFIEAKDDYGRITNANVSVAISERFMEAVRNDAGWQLEFPSTSDPNYNSDWDGDLERWKRDGRATNIHRSLPARRIWDAIAEHAWRSGEPGVVFLGRYNEQSTGAHAERIISVNPCGEQGLGAYSVCNLGAMNLDAYVKDGEFDFDGYRDDVRIAVRFLDNVIDKSYYWDARSQERQQDLRRIGLGVMGLADALIHLGVRYGSSEAVAFTEKVFALMKDTAISTSIELAREKGPARAYTPEVWKRPYLREYLYRNQVTMPGDYMPLRNLFFLTQAPTGTTSILAGVNSGIEPYFAFSYTRKDRTGEHRVVADIVQQFDPAVRHDFLVTSNDVTVEEHIAMQAAVQMYVDSSVSKTINGPNRHTVEDVKKAYDLAYRSGLKGLAYFRDGSGRDQVLYKDAPEPTETEPLGPQLEKAYARIAQLEEVVVMGPKASDYRRPARVSGTTSRLNTSMGTMYLTINVDEEFGDPIEVFVNVGKAGSDVMAMGEAIGRLVSLALQTGVPVSKVSEQLVGVGGTSNLNPGLVHAVGKALAEIDIVKGLIEDAEADDEEEDWEDEVVAQPAGDVCPECGGSSLVREEGCQKCYLCGFSKC